MITDEEIVEKFVEISTCARKSGKNGRLGERDPGRAPVGSTGRQNGHACDIRVLHVFLHLELFRFVKI